MADPKCCDYDKRTPLHLAASEGSYKVAEWLLEQKADVNALDRFKRTPLEVCAPPLCCAHLHELPFRHRAAGAACAARSMHTLRSCCPSSRVWGSLAAPCAPSFIRPEGRPVS